MSDYIKREDAEQIMYSYGIGGTIFVDDLLKPSKSEEARQKEVWESVRKVLNRVAVKDVEPIKRGHWIYNGCDIVCSECGTAFSDEVCYMMRDDVSYHEPKHCLWCGAEMSEDTEY